MREKISRSLNSRDLSDESWENSLHIIASLGASQINRKHLSIGAHLHHIRAGHVQFLPRVLALLTAHVASRARRQGWKGVTRLNSPNLAKLALDRFLHNLCEDCHGVGRIGELGSVIVICPVCKGTGKRRFDLAEMATMLNVSVRMFRDLELIERVKDTVSMLDRMEGFTTSGTKKQARGLT